EAVAELRAVAGAKSGTGSRSLLLALLDLAGAARATHDSASERAALRELVEGLGDRLLWLPAPGGGRQELGERALRQWVDACQRDAAAEAADVQSRWAARRERARAARTVTPATTSRPAIDATGRGR
ncbi:MAG: hypothetical protein KDC87_10985, partial [Planctomycetes bacterium]|nr:hypothetical protein [Planctomycetota bacterium]